MANKKADHLDGEISRMKRILSEMFSPTILDQLFPKVRRWELQGLTGWKDDKVAEKRRQAAEDRRKAQAKSESGICLTTNAESE